MLQRRAPTTCSNGDAAHARTRDQLRAVHRSTERMRRLIHDLLNVAAIDAGQLVVVPAPVSVDGRVAKAVDVLCPLANAKGITLEADVAHELPVMNADRERLLQVLANLGGNAIKFTPKNGRIVFAAVPSDDGVQLSVRDTGSGIAPENLPHVFDRFWQARETARFGTGLGLSIVRGLVEAHGGRVHAESVVGEGTPFIFNIPASLPNRARSSGDN
ncbi:MAG: HAMP domain-containing sensor histidine kinase [Gemmatimonadaceae bacterium]